MGVLCPLWQLEKQPPMHASSARPIWKRVWIFVCYELVFSGKFTPILSWRLSAGKTKYTSICQKYTSVKCPRVINILEITGSVPKHPVLARSAYTWSYLDTVLCSTCVHIGSSRLSKASDSRSYDSFNWRNLGWIPGSSAGKACLLSLHSLFYTKAMCAGKKITKQTDH